MRKGWRSLGMVQKGARHRWAQHPPGRSGNGAWHLFEPWRYLLVTAWLLGIWGGFGLVAAAPAASPAKPSIGESISDSFKSGMKKLTKFFTPEPSVKPVDDPVSLNAKAKPGPELYLSTGLLAEQRGNLEEAEKRYQQALKLDSKHLGTLVAYARLKDRQNQWEEAVRLYEQAAKAHPKQPAVFNDLGLCYARRGQLKEAAEQLDRAIQLKPREVLYRNNMATILVQAGQVDRAFEHLRAAHDEAVACYNLGYLLQKSGQSKAAVAMFAQALEKNPSMTEAQIWLEKLNDASASRPTGSRYVDVTDRPPAQPAPPAMAAQQAAGATATPFAQQVVPKAENRPAPVPQPIASRPSFTSRFPRSAPEVRQLPPVSPSDPQPAFPSGSSPQGSADRAEDAPLPSGDAFPSFTFPLPPANAAGRQR